MNLLIETIHINDKENENSRRTHRKRETFYSND
jgi:hypothetical protein